MQVIGGEGPAGIMAHSRGSLLPFRKLHGPQAVTTLSHDVRPPRERGITWSKVRSGVGWDPPQYWHSK